ncbi:MAG: DNA mismatch repair protein MutS, partial [Ignavibacteria bacterium]
MAQYYKIKQQYPDTILLFRVGDFFETFEEDAKLTSKALGITLTKRANGKAEKVPLAGFPHHALDTYLPKLVRAGYRVAVCEQAENPKFAKGIVKREVIEVVSPGVAFSDKLLDHKRNNYLAAFFLDGDKLGISFADVSTADYFVYEIPAIELNNQLGLINPSEILISKKQKNELEAAIQKVLPNVRITKIDEWIFHHDFGRDLLLNHFQTQNLKGFGIENFTCGISAAGAVLNYLKETQKENISHINHISIYNPSDYMQLDFATKRNLEIMYTMQDGAREGSLISILDKTETAMGGRLLKRWMLAPLRKLEPILQRQSAVEDLFNNKTLRKNLQNELREIGDLERLISRVCTSRANPRELVFLKTSLQKIPLLKQLLDQSGNETIKIISEKLDPLEDLCSKIEMAITDNPPSAITEGGIIRTGYNPELDELRDISQNAKTWIANLQAEEREKTGIPSLKVAFNKVFGYYIDISNAHKDKVPEHYIRKQTLVNSERYITPELKEWEDKILNAQEKIEDLEYHLFDEVRSFTSAFVKQIQENANLISMLDCFQSLAECAEQYQYVKPVVDESDKIEVENGRHPVVERILPPGEKFQPNSVKLDNEENQIIILTGPNMAGKSVFLRQIGLIVMLAQIGSFVPAEKAHIG